MHVALRRSLHRFPLSSVKLTFSACDHGRLPELQAAPVESQGEGAPGGSSYARLQVLVRFLPCAWPQRKIKSVCRGLLLRLLEAMSTQKGWQCVCPPRQPRRAYLCFPHLL